MTIDPVNVFVVCVLIAFVALVIFLKKASDKADKETQDRKERK